MRPSSSASRRARLSSRLWRSLSWRSMRRSVRWSAPRRSASATAAASSAAWPSCQRGDRAAEDVAHLGDHDDRRGRPCRRAPPGRGRTPRAPGAPTPASRRARSMRPPDSRAARRARRRASTPSATSRSSAAASVERDERDLLAPAADRLQDLAGRRRHEHEAGARRRLLERLEQPGRDVVGHALGLEAPRAPWSRPRRASGTRPRAGRRPARG